MDLVLGASHLLIWALPIAVVLWVEGCKVALSCAAWVLSVLQGHCYCVRNSYPKIPVFLQYKYDGVRLVHALGEGSSRDKR